MTFDEMKQIMEFVITSQANLSTELATMTGNINRLEQNVSRLEQSVTGLERTVHEMAEQAGADRHETRAAMDELIACVHEPPTRWPFSACPRLT